MSMQAMLAATGGSAAKPYVDDVFSAYTYTGNGASQTINNGIDLAGKGGLVWIKSRSATYHHHAFDTNRGVNKRIYQNLINAEVTTPGSLTAFNSNGFSLGAETETNAPEAKFVSWTFRKAPKFFDVVSYVGNGGSTARTISHALGSAPGMIIIKCVSVVGNFFVYHRGVGPTGYLLLNGTDPATISTNPAWNMWNSTDPTSSVFTLSGSNNTDVNGAGKSYVAYLFAHAASADGLIQCGSYVGNGNATGPNVTLGWEPQYLLIKNASTANGVGWHIADCARGLGTNLTAAHYLLANNTDPDTSTTFPIIGINATGFSVCNPSVRTNEAGSTYIYMAIRRPNKPPTSGAQVYNAIARAGTGDAATVTGVGFAPDLSLTSLKGGYSGLPRILFDRLRGAKNRLFMATNTETNIADQLTSFNNDGVVMGADAEGHINTLYFDYINWFFRRAPGFMDVVCYTGTGVARTVSHGLGVAPELMIVKSSSLNSNWAVYVSGVGVTKSLWFNNAAEEQPYGSNYWNSTAPSSSLFTLGTDAGVNSSGNRYVAYLFATLLGISKVFSYTGNGVSQIIPCGFSNGARFVLIKRTDAAGDWFVWDTVRGIVADNDPHLSLNTTTPEVTTNDSVDPEASGFIVNQATATNININGATYIGLAIA